MPVRLPDGKQRRVVLLDTNAVSELVNSHYGERGAFLDRFPPASNAVCLTAYNLVELRRRKPVYTRFDQELAAYWSLLARPSEQLVELELRARGAIGARSVFYWPPSIVGEGMKDLLELVAADQLARDVISNWREQEQEILSAWTDNWRQFHPEKPDANSHDARRYVELALFGFLAAQHPWWMRQMVEAGHSIDPADFPSLQMSLFSQYYRLHEARRPLAPQDVTDVQFAAVIPYVDAVVTEAFQADLIRKVRNDVRGLETVEIVSLRALRTSTE